jgi:hypothetical protein
MIGETRRDVLLHVPNLEISARSSIRDEWDVQSISFALRARSHTSLGHRPQASDRMVGPALKARFSAPVHREVPDRSAPE